MRSGSGFLGGLLESRLSLGAGEEVELSGGGIEALDGALLGELLDECAGDRTVDLELLHEGAAGDDENLGDLRGHLGEALLIEEDVVVELILYLDLGPGLFLGLGALSGTSLLGGLGALRRRLARVFTTLLCFGLKSDENLPECGRHLPCLNTY